MNQVYKNLALWLVISLVMIMLFNMIVITSYSIHYTKLYEYAKNDTS